MFLLSLEVKNFRVLHDVPLKFGRGLNILFGPNDLGKSTLAEALRVAFLLPATSTAWRDLKPWGTELVPRVVVRFEMNDVVWQITKTFEGTKGTALLERVGEGGNLSEEGSGRAVEEKLREILSWGVPGPGGKGAPRGLPESYLSTALLGRQDQETAILAASPEEDGVNSGLELVRSALGASGKIRSSAACSSGWKSDAARLTHPLGNQKRTARSTSVHARSRSNSSGLKELEERVLRSKEIETRVDLLTELGERAAVDCKRLHRRVELLRGAKGKEHELERIQANERSAEEGRRDLAAIEKNLLEKESSQGQATSALLKVEEVHQAARDRLQKIMGGRDKVQENAQQARETRRAELIAIHDGAVRQAHSARAVIQVREQVQVRERELALAEGDHQKSQQAEPRTDSCRACLPSC